MLGTTSWSMSATSSRRRNRSTPKRRCSPPFVTTASRNGVAITPCPLPARCGGAHRGGGGKREKAISPGRGGAGEEIVNAHLSLGLEIIPIVHRNYHGWTIGWSFPARRPTRDHEFESDFLQRGVWCEPHFLDQGGPLGFAP